MPCPSINFSTANSATELQPIEHNEVYSAGQQVKVEWNGSWWDALIREMHAQKYLIHYIGFDSSWDEWVDETRIKLV